MRPLSSGENAEWLLDLDQKRWDDQLDADSDSWKLDFLFEETTLDWPPTA